MACTVWGDQAENVANAINKGERLIVTGSLKPYTYTDNTGQTQSGAKLIVEEIGKTLRYAPREQPAETDDLNNFYQKMKDSETN